MPRGNPHPVVKGRKRGVPNKFSIARAERAIAEGRKQPAEELLRNAENCRAMVMFFAPTRPNADTKQAEINPNHNPKDYFDWLAAERDALGRAAPYYSPRLSAVALQPLQLDKDKELRGDPRVALLEMILQMRDRDEIGQSALPAPKGNGHGEIIDAVVAKVVEEGDDNGDGEAA
jgi:hypothetical protein